MIVERLKDCIPLIVSPFQTEFVPGRNIHENIVVACEVVTLWIKCQVKKGFFGIKVDLPKTYDKISWEFIWRMLVEIKFLDNMIHVIMHPVTSVETNVKWNGDKDEFSRL